MSLRIDIAREHWGDDLPDWVEVLALAIDQTSQNRAAAQIGRSAALVSNVIRNKYTGDMVAVELAVRAGLMKETVTCPVLGEIALATCLDWRNAAKHFAPVNTSRVTMYRACKRCWRNKPEQPKGGGDE